ncbi:MAG: alcohol dehydrogenase catalytic domain-containing protein [Streptosporangiales bacterium]|nr:alcohol dehydrogenase catalytic domain-containing protein [Streptosporangiales bacterium]
MKITAAVAWRAGAPLEIEEVELDEPRDDEILVRVAAAGICHTDMHARDGHLPVELPMILGHEGAGTVEGVGSDVTQVAVGDKVLLTPDYCGRCRRCRMGQTTYCDNLVAVTFSGLRPDGSPRARQGDAAIRAAFFGQSSFASHALATERNVLKVPHDAPLHHLAALTCGLPTGAGSVLNVVPVTVGSSFAVFGAGAVGLGAVMAAVVAGATEIIAVDRVAHRLETATELGATHVIHTEGGGDVAEEIREHTGGGCDVILDTTGVPALIRTAVESLDTRGTCGIVAGSGQDLSIPAAPLVRGGRTLRGIIGGEAIPGVFVPKLIALHERGRFPFDRLVRNYPFRQINEAIADSISGTTIKPVLTFV